MKKILIGFLGATCFSAFIYMSYFDIHAKAIYTIFAISGFYIILHSDKKTLLYFGFFVGIFWFYWISLSFIYYEISYLIPLGIIGIALIYAGIFYIVGMFTYVFRIMPILLLEYIHPFGFNYLNPKLTLVDSYIKIDDIYFILLLLTLYSIGHIYKNKKIKNIYILIIAPMIFMPSLFAKDTHLQKPNLNIKLINTTINQDTIWNMKSVNKSKNKYFKMIQDAIENKKDAIVFPEGAFKIALNTDYEAMNTLKRYSNDITIIAGSSYIDSTKKYNSTYIFNKNKMQVIHKYILTPFGEKVPLPKFITNIINNIFYDGSSDLDNANHYGEFEIKNYTFRNAICFEASRDEIYENNPKYLIAISNNAWFTPSIQPTLQNIYLKYMSKKYNTVIYHATNKGKNIVIN